jgi:hypothetical protein
MVDGLISVKRKQTPEELRAYEENYDRIFRKDKKNGRTRPKEKTYKG